MKKMIVILSSVTLLAACNGLQWNSDILGGASRAPQAGSGSAATAADPGAPLSAIPDDTELSGVETGDVETGGVETATGSAAANGAVAGYSGRASTVASLGDPSIPGLWMETPLVRSEQPGRLRSPNGKEVTVTLRPTSGEASSGSRVSISAMRALGAPLTELIELQVLPAS